MSKSKFDFIECISFFYISNVDITCFFYKFA